MTTNERSRMAASSRAVALIWVSAPVTVQTSILLLRRGSGSPVPASTRARNRSPNGSPNRKRTCVAPTVPSDCVSSLCWALRSTCPAAATTVNMAHRPGMWRFPREDERGAADIAG